jgi:hypothetical protein
MHIVFKYNNPNLCTNLGELLISYRALSLSYHDILFLSNWFFGSFDCLLHSLKFIHLVIFSNLWSSIYCVFLHVLVIGYVHLILFILWEIHFVIVDNWGKFRGFREMVLYCRRNGTQGPHDYPVARAGFSPWHLRRNHDTQPRYASWWKRFKLC